MTNSGYLIELHHTKLELFHNQETGKQIVNEVVALDMDAIKRAILVSSCDPVAAGDILKSLIDNRLNRTACKLIEKKTSNSLHNEHDTANITLRA